MKADSSQDEDRSGKNEDPLQERRKRNSAASARFRQKKKLREQQVEEEARAMTARVYSLERKVKVLEAEASYLRHLIALRTENEALQSQNQRQSHNQTLPQNPLNSESFYPVHPSQPGLRHDIPRDQIPSYPIHPSSRRSPGYTQTHTHSGAGYIQVFLFLLAFLLVHFLLLLHFFPFAFFLLSFFLSLSLLRLFIVAPNVLQKKKKRKEKKKKPDLLFDILVPYTLQASSSSSSLSRSIK